MTAAFPSPIIMKFGGTSVADAQRLRVVADVVASRLAQRPVVVVSALAGVTNLLDQAARCAGSREGAGIASAIQEVSRRHVLALQSVESEKTRAALAGRVETIMEELRLLLRGMELLGEATPRSLDAILAAGERISSHVMAAVLADRGVPAKHVDARDVIITDDRHGAATPLAEPTQQRCEGKIHPILDAGEVPVIGGFIGATIQGTTSTLGRGGSDLSASFLGARLGASEIQIWTDVDGMMTADPRVAPNARVLPRISFDEAAELAYFGARVLHPATIHPALEREIPVRVLNTLRPSSEGTLITRRAAACSSPVKAIAFKTGLTVVTVNSTRMLMAHGFLARIFDVFDRHATPVDLVSTSEVSVSLTVDDSRHVPRIGEELSAFARVQVEEGMAIVCLVGEELLRRSGIAARIFDALKRINVRMISLGASEINLSLVVAQDDAATAVRELHRAFFEN